MRNTCPTCNRPLPSSKRGRCCAQCGEPIRRHDKYHFEGAVVVHNDCNNPRMDKMPQPMTMELLP